MAHQNNFPGALREIASGWSASELDLVPGEGFWSRIEEIAVKGEMTRGLDAAMQGQSSPRVWLFLHEPGRGDLSAAVAMSFARELAFRDQAVLLLDCDDRDQTLTRWTGRIEAEGWIDLARYGTSVLTSGVAMPFVGRRGYFLGVGSFAPTDVTAEEIDTLLTRLRRQGDDIMLVAPSDFPGLLWAPQAGVRILCWDRQSMDESEAAIIAGGFSEAGCPLTAVATFHSAGPAEERLVDQVLSEVKGQAAPSPVMPVEPNADESCDPVVAENVADLTEDSRQPDLSPEIAASTAGQEFDQEFAGGLEPELAPMPVGKSSRVFWFSALAAVVLIAMIAVYYFKFVRVPSLGPVDQTEVAQPTDPSTRPDRFAEPQGEDLVSAADQVAAIDSAVVDHRQELLDGTPVEIQAADESAADSVIIEEIADTVEAPQDEIPADTPPPPPSGFDMGPYRETVGAKGWALHVYSLPNQAATSLQVQELSRRGFQSEVRIFDLGDKGTWRRIFVGNFASRTEAKQAMPALLKKLREKWAQPVRF